MKDSQMDTVEWIARTIMQWEGGQGLAGPYPWDCGSAPESAAIDPATGEPKESRRSRRKSYFTRSTNDLLVFGPENSHGQRGAGFFFNPFTNPSSAQMVLAKLGNPDAITALVTDAIAQVKR